MMRAGDFISRQSNVLLESRRRAIICAVILSILPFASWLSVALVCLVTLRKGAKSGFDVMLPALVVHTVPLMLLVPWVSALINTLITYIPCYLAAISLRKTGKWQVVFGVFLILVSLGCLLIQLLIPELIVYQFNQFKTVLMQYQQLVDKGTEGLSTLVLAQLIFGIQILSLIVSAIISLMFARSIQAKLFLPDGFRNELLEFRSGRLSFLVLIGISLASYYEVPWAINILPIILCYFLVSGFALAFYVFARKKKFQVFMVLLLLILLNPPFVLLGYIVFGSLDSMFNFRVYLPARVREST